MIGLTPNQSKLLGFIREHLARHGSSPSYEEMTRAMGLASKGHVHRMVIGLEERGHVQRLPNRQRSIALTEPSGLRSDLEAWASAHCRRTGITRETLIERAFETYRRSAP